MNSLEEEIDSAEQSIGDGKTEDARRSTFHNSHDMSAYARSAAMK
jgi:hypothetical protein